MGDSRGNLSNSGVNQAIQAYFGEGIGERIQTAIATEYLGEIAIGTALVVITGHPQHPFLVYAPAIADFGATPLPNAPYLATRAVLLAARHHNRQNYARPHWQMRTLVLTLMGLSGMEWGIDTIVKQMLQAVISCQEENA